MNQTGFDPVDAGSLADSWRQQPCTPTYCCDYDAHGMRLALAKAVPRAAVAVRERMPKFFAKLGAAPTNTGIIAANRSANIVPNTN